MINNLTLHSIYNLKTKINYSYPDTRNSFFSELSPSVVLQSNKGLDRLIWGL